MWITLRLTTVQSRCGEFAGGGPIWNSREARVWAQISVNGSNKGLHGRLVIGAQGDTAATEKDSKSGAAICLIRRADE